MPIILDEILSVSLEEVVKQIKQTAQNLEFPNAFVGWFGVSPNSQDLKKAKETIEIWITEEVLKQEDAGSTSGDKLVAGYVRAQPRTDGCKLTIERIEPKPYLAFASTGAKVFIDTTHGELKGRWAVRPSPGPELRIIADREIDLSSLFAELAYQILRGVAGKDRAEDWKREPIDGEPTTNEPATIERFYNATKDAIEKDVRDFTRDWKPSGVENLNVDWVGGQLVVSADHEYTNGLKWDDLQFVKLEITTHNSERVKVRAWAMGGGDLLTSPTWGNAAPTFQDSANTFLDTLIQYLDRATGWQATRSEPSANQEVTKDWQNPPEEPDMMGKPGNPGLPHGELIARLAKAQEGVEIKERDPQKTWKQVAQEIAWRYGNNPSGIKLLEDARNKLKRANEGTLQELKEWRKKKKKR